MSVGMSMTMSMGVVTVEGVGCAAWFRGVDGGAVAIRSGFDLPLLDNDGCVFVGASEAHVECGCGCWCGVGFGSEVSW